MKQIKKFKMGSSYFFHSIPGFKSKDADELILMDNWVVPNTNVLNCRSNISGKDIFFFKNMSKTEFLEDALRSKVPMRAGKFLVKEFAEHLGMTIQDLEKLEPLFLAMDEKHTYEKLIYDAYIANQGWFLTDDQLADAYKEYLAKSN